MSAYLAFVKNNLRWLAAGMLLTFASSFGQTYFISLFGAQIRSAFHLSHGDFGLVYMLATLTSAAVLVQLGRLADHMRLLTLGLATIGGLAMACCAMALSKQWLWLAVTLFFLRLFGQGMMSHVAMTAMARWFNLYRGRALGIAALGFAVGEAVLPPVFFGVTVYAGWRGAWWLAAGFLLLAAGPALFGLARHERQPGQSGAHAGNAPGTGAVQESIAGGSPAVASWTRLQALGDWRLYALLPGMFAPAFIMTATFFHQAHIVAGKGWSMAMWTAYYPFLAVASIVFSLVAGWAIDRWSARALLAVFLLPMAGGLGLLAGFDQTAGGLAAMVLFGMTAGASLTISSALWAELYGVVHLGSIKALLGAGAVLASALGPGVTGALMDRGIAYETQMAVMAGYALVASAGFVLLTGWLMEPRAPRAASLQS